MEDSLLTSEPPAIGRLLAWLWRKIGTRSLVAWGLLLVALASAGYGVLDGVRGIDGSLVAWVVLLGALAGWLLARLPISGWLASLPALLLGVGLVFARVGRLFDEALVALHEMSNLVAAYLYRPPALPLPNGAPLLEALAALGQAVAVLALRMQAWLSALRGSQTFYDPVGANLAWGLALWCVSAWAAWWIRRREQPLAALTPPGALLAFTLATVGGPAYLLLAVLLAAFLLMVWVGYTGRELRWQRSGVDFSEDVRLDIGLAVMGLVLALTAAAAFAPSVSITGFVDFLHELRRPAPAAETNRVARSLGLEPRPNPARESRLDPLRSGGLPRLHLLGSGPELSQEVALRIQTGEFPAGPPELVVAGGLPRYYWRSLAYDIYTGRGWSTSPTRLLDYAAGHPIAEPTGPRRLLEGQVQVVQATPGLVYAPGELLAVSEPYQAAWRSMPGSAREPADLFGSDLFAASIEPGEYRFTALVLDASEDELRAAGESYPAWVINRYLRLPPDLPARVANLARDLTATQPTPYDRARAIEEYIRSFPYTLDLPPPPIERDTVDYFLFDLKKGFCDYDASAMVVLARAAGLPARLAVGYATGSYDSYQARYIVTEADAHSWPEIYFPGYGWVMFEPTSGRPALPRTGQAQPAGEPRQGQPAKPAPRAAFDWNRALAALAWLALGLAVFATAWRLAAPLRLQRLAPQRALSELFGDLHRQALALGVRSPPGDTPAEFSRRLSALVERRPLAEAWRGWLAPAPGELAELADLYARSLYGPHPPGALERSLAVGLWSRLRLRLWALRALGRRR